MENIILVGFGGHAKSVADCIERQNEYSIVGYTDFEKHDYKYKYLGNDDVLKDYYAQGVQNAVVCIGYLGKGSLREKLYSLLKDIGYTLPIIMDPTAIISETAEIGEGTFIGKGAIVNASVNIGKMTIINTMALIEHECVISDYSHVAVAAVLCGQVNVGEASFIGANATVIQGRTILPHQIVPAGAIIK